MAKRIESGVKSTQEALEYWDGRHRSVPGLRAGGDLGFDEPGNQVFYALRLALLLRIIGDGASPAEPLFALDAGCGAGWFSRRLAQCGHRVDGIDASAVAVEHCRGRGGGPRYARSTLAAWHCPWLYDVVFSVDVLFHILDDGEWEASVANLAALVRLGGRLAVTDWDTERRRVLGDYQLVRPASSYRRLVARAGLRYDEFLPYGFRGSPVGFHVATRVS